MNNLRAVMEAVLNSVDSINNQELAAGKTTTVNMHIEQKEYNDYQVKLKDSLAYVTRATSDVQSSQGAAWATAELQNAQANFNNLQTTQQTNTQQCDGATQAEQTQVGELASQAQAKVQLEAAINTYMQQLASALGR